MRAHRANLNMSKLITVDFRKLLRDIVDRLGAHAPSPLERLAEASAGEQVIRTMGRWCSDIHRLYVRACFERCCEWTRRAGSVVVTDVARIIDEDDEDE